MTEKINLKTYLEKCLYQHCFISQLLKAKQILESVNVTDKKLTLFMLDETTKLVKLKKIFLKYLCSTFPENFREIYEYLRESDELCYTSYNFFDESKFDFETNKFYFDIFWNGCIEFNTNNGKHITFNLLGNYDSPDFKWICSENTLINTNGISIEVSKLTQDYKVPYLLKVVCNSDSLPYKPISIK